MSEEVRCGVQPSRRGGGSDDAKHDEPRTRCRNPRKRQRSLPQHDLKRTLELTAGPQKPQAQTARGGCWKRACERTRLRRKRSDNGGTKQRSTTSFSSARLKSCKNYGSLSPPVRVFPDKKNFVSPFLRFQSVSSVHSVSSKKQEPASGRSRRRERRESEFEELVSGPTA